MNSLDPHVPNRNTKVGFRFFSVLGVRFATVLSCIVLCIAFSNSVAEPNRNTDVSSKRNRPSSISNSKWKTGSGAKDRSTAESKISRRSLQNSQKLIILSVDGFPYLYWKDPKYRLYFPNLTKIFQTFGEPNEILTVNPSITYPAHTSMVTGEDPILHGIWNNTVSDPFEKNDGGWMWYTEDIQVPTLWDLAREKKLKTANVFWPVTVGAKIDWNLPQYWRKKIQEDDKLLRVLSTEGLHTEVALAVGTPLNDTTGDEVKLKTASYVWNKKKPDLMFVYTTDLDTFHHGYGKASERALSKLREIDSFLDVFFKEVGAFTKNGPGIILVSDHGFHKASQVCAPNVYLKERGFIDDVTGTYRLTFKSSGGTAILLPNGEIPSSSDLYQIQSHLTQFCPGVEWISKQDKGFLNSYHPEALAILRTSGEIYISGTRKGALLTDTTTPIFGHGYWNEMEEMHTIGFAYLPKSKKKIRFTTVKDVFPIAKEYLKLQ